LIDIQIPPDPVGLRTPAREEAVCEKRQPRDHIRKGLPSIEPEQGRPQHQNARPSFESGIVNTNTKNHPSRLEAVLKFLVSPERERKSDGQGGRIRPYLKIRVDLTNADRRFCSRAKTAGDFKTAS
jgi:hypothetical protein